MDENNRNFILAIVLSIVIHMRHSYKPRNTLEVVDDEGRVRTAPLSEGAEMLPGLIVYRFAHSLYYANANLFAEEVLSVVDSASPRAEWFCLEASAIADVDISASETLREVHGQLGERGVRFVVSNLGSEVRRTLAHYGTTELLGDDAIFDSVRDVRHAFEARRRTP